MKKIVFLLATIIIATFFATFTQAAMEKDKITLFGDDSFKAEILKGSNNDVLPNSLFVSNDGNDSNNGSISAPYKTIQKALDNVKAGQTIYVRKGTYTANNIFKSSGTEGNYITLRNYPNETPYLTSNTSGAIISTDSNSYLKIEGLEIGGLSAPQAYGILANGSENHIIIRNNNIHNLVTTKPNENEDGEANGILFFGEQTTEELSINNVCIENNYVHNNVTGWCESVSVTGNVKYVNIINNKVENNTNIGIDFYGNAGYCSNKALDQPRYCVAAGNTVTGSKCDYAECAGLYVDGARDIILENNNLNNNMYGIEIGSEEGHRTEYVVKNIIVRNNLVYNNSAGGIRVGGYDKKTTGYVTDTKIYNNTIVNNGEGEGGWNGELCFVKCNGVDVKNNIVYKDNTEYPMIGGDLPSSYVLNVKFGKNIFYNPLGAEEIYFEFAGGSAEGISAFNTQTGGNDTFGKPVFNTDYSLKLGSYGIDLGSQDVISYMGSLTDFANNYRVINTIDAGAFEYQDGSKPTVSTTTESTTETTTENSTETTTVAIGSSSTWNFTDGSWSDKATGSTLYNVNGLSVRHNGSYNDTMGFKFDKNTKSVKTEGYYIGLNAKKDDKITIYVNYNSSKTGNYVGLSLAKVEGTSFNVKDSAKVEAKKTGTYSITFTVPEDGEYIIYTDNNSSGSAYYSKVVLEKPAKIGDFNLDGNVDVKDASDILKHSSNINTVTNETSIKNGDLNTDKKVDLFDAILLLNNLITV